MNGPDFKEIARRLKETIQQYNCLSIYIKGSPDPDAIAASYVLKLICKHYGVKATIDSPIYPSLPQNIKIVKDLQLPIKFKEPDNAKNQYDGYAVLDHQSAMVEGLTGVLPCALHIDHHEPVDDKINIDLKISYEEVGATSTIMIFIMKELEEELAFKRSIRIKTATALYYGIQTDTDDFQHAGELDKEALRIISDDCDLHLIERLASLPFSRESMGFLNLALQNQIVYKEWLISGIGFIDGKHRDAVAIIGDFLLKREDVTTVIVFFIVEDRGGMTLNASFRTKDPDLNMNALIKRITSDGGARKYKGAYQVNLDYFSHCSDKELLWQVVHMTTVEALKAQRDSLGMEEFKHYFRQLGHRFRELFQKGE